MNRRAFLGGAAAGLAVGPGVAKMAVANGNIPTTQQGFFGYPTDVADSPIIPPSYFDAMKKLETAFYRRQNTSVFGGFDADLYSLKSVSDTWKVMVQLRREDARQTWFEKAKAELRKKFGVAD